VNYFAHALPHLDSDPRFLAGTAAPDWMAVADRPVRVRARLAEPLAADPPDESTRQVALGALRHLHDDGWFHSTRGFVEITDAVARLFRSALGPDDPMRCGFLGHLVTELLLDAVLIERRPDQLDRYYQRLAEIDPLEIQSAVNRMARGQTSRLAVFIPLFLRERFLYDYAADETLLPRLNRVLRRVRLSELPDRTIEALAEARVLVRRRWSELLPADLYPQVEQVGVARQRHPDQ